MKSEKAPSRRQAVDRLQRSLQEIPPEESPSEEGFRINRYLAASGLGARREVEHYIREGRVRLNDDVITDLNTRVRSEDRVTVDGEVIELPTTAIHIALNKPVGYVMSRRGFPGDRIIYELLPLQLQGLKYGGRLDRESRGLVLLSNDGDFIQALTHPSRRLTKTYEVTIDHFPPDLDIDRAFYSGIEDRGELLRALRFQVLDRAAGRVEVVLGQGKNRQIRRMFTALNIKVLDLYRSGIGFLNLNKTPVAPGKFISIQPEDVFYGPKKDK